VPDEWQARVLDSDAPQIVINCSRQVGKSTTSEVKVAHKGLYPPGSTFLLLARSERQSIELMHKAKGFIEAEGIGVTRLTRTQAEFENGSRIFALPGKESTVRGYSGAELVVIDEAYFEYVTAEDYPNSIELLSLYKNILILRTFSKVDITNTIFSLQSPIDSCGITNL
jgi:hypothetical protein